MEIIKHNSVLSSIRFKNVYDIFSNGIWDLLFNDFEIEKAYFKGVRPHNSEYSIVDSEMHDGHIQLLEIRAGQLLMNRDFVQSEWNNFEYPSILIIPKYFDTEVVDLNRFIGLPPMEFTNEHPETIILFKSSEEDVVWISGGKE